VALGYAMLAIVLVAFAFYRRNEEAPAEVLEANAQAMEGGPRPALPAWTIAPEPQRLRRVGVSSGGAS
jgi:hypothetical protein